MMLKNTMKPYVVLLYGLSILVITVLVELSLHLCMHLCMYLCISGACPPYMFKLPVRNALLQRDFYRRANAPPRRGAAAPLALARRYV